MSLETNLRYESPHVKRRVCLSQTFRQQPQQDHEFMENKRKAVRLEQQLKLKTNLDEAVSNNEAYRKKLNFFKAELKFVNTAFNAVRKAGLKKLMEKERAMYAKELQEMGKTFYFQRV